MSLRLFLVRHGETEYSRTGSYCGSLDPELTANGARMAEQLAEAYRTTKWVGAYVSPLKRTLATARPLCAEVGLEIKVRDGLREITYGDWEGKSQDEVRAGDPERFISWMTEPAWNSAPGGETAVQVAARASVVAAEIIATHHEGNVLVVSHKATIRLLLCDFLGIDLGRYRDRIDTPAGSVNVVKFGKYGPMLERLGDRTYMSADLQAEAGT